MNNTTKVTVENEVVERQWGSYTVLHVTSNSKVKILDIFPMKQLSLQNHQHRDEHWIIIQGRAIISDGTEAGSLEEGQYIWIPKLTLHTVYNPSHTVNLIIAEVQYSQSGVCEESDITRYNEDGSVIK